MKVVTIDSEESAWDLFIRSIEDATSYHRLKWRNVITESFGHNCHYLAAIDNNGEWQGVLPLVHMRSRLFGHFLISVPFVNYGGLLCNNDSAAGVLLDEAERLRRSLGATQVELRHAGRGLTGIPSRQHKVAMVLDLAPDSDRPMANVQCQAAQPDKKGEEKWTAICGWSPRNPGRVLCGFRPQHA